MKDENIDTTGGQKKLEKETRNKINYVTWKRKRIRGSKIVWKHRSELFKKKLRSDSCWKRI